jgi:hypothetical protein
MPSEEHCKKDVDNRGDDACRNKINDDETSVSYLLPLELTAVALAPRSRSLIKG